MDRISVLVPDAEAQINPRVARCLNASGRVVLHGLSRRRSALLRHSCLYATFECSTDAESKLSSWLGRIDEIVARRKIDFVLPISDFGVRTLSEHGRSLICADKLVQLPKHHIFDLATNKASLAGFLTARDIPQPPTVLVTAGTHTTADLSALEFPVLAKPPLLAGGQGIKRCESRAELYNFLASKPDGETWVVQELLEGFDVCVNVLCQDGEIIASTSQRAIDQPRFSFRPPTDFEFKHDSSATELARRLMKELVWSGIACIDMRFDAKRKSLVVLEVNGRYWASVLGSMNAGVNFPLLACESASGLICSNLLPRNSRYFRGPKNVLRSLIGGGKHRIKPGETDLRYVVQDLLRLTSSLTTTGTASVRDQLSGLHHGSDLQHLRRNP